MSNQYYVDLQIWATNSTSSSKYAISLCVMFSFYCYFRFIDYFRLKNAKWKMRNVSKPGGELIAVRRDINAKQLTLSHTFEDAITVLLTDKTKAQKLLISCNYNAPKNSPYRWPHEKRAQFLTSLKNKRKQLKVSSSLITGDNKFVHTSWGSMQSTGEYANTVTDQLAKLKYEQRFDFQCILGSQPQLHVFLIDEPVYWLNSTIDTTLTDNYSINLKKCSDNPFFSSLLTFNNATEKYHKIVKYANARTNGENFNQTIVDKSFGPYCYSNVDEVTNQWYLWFNKLFTENVPRITSQRSYLPPWISKPTSHLINQLNTLKPKEARKAQPLNLQKVLDLEIKIEIESCNDQVDYENEIFRTRDFSKIQAYLRSIKKAPPYPHEMHWKNKVAENDEEKANLFNQYFQSVFKLKTNNTNVDFGPNTFNKITCCEKLVKKILNSKSKKAKGQDRIGNETVKQPATTLAKSLTVIFQTCFKSVYPQYWKESEITPIYKDGDKSDVTKYRPIKCLCCPSKVLEKVSFDWLYPVLRQQLHDSQFGFRNGGSAIVQIVCILAKVYLLNDSSAIDELTVFYLDFKKAFDKVPHDLLLLKIHKMGIDGTARKLIANYLDNRKQCVKKNNSRSEFRDVTSRVPQGSLLGPLLFLINMNDLPTVASES